MRKSNLWFTFRRKSSSSHFLGYNHRFKRSLQKTHPNIWLFIDSIRNEVHDLIAQIDSEMQPREEKVNPKLFKDELKNYMIASTRKKLRLNL
jgi:hypothetical protein